MNTKPLAMRDVFLDNIWQTMSRDDKIFFVCADFGSPVLDRIRRDFPERFINVGIAEQSLINVTAGLAIEGFKVFAYAIAPFITMRCYEQIRVSLALLSEVRPVNVSLIGVGAGYSYVVSGPTHQCYEDITLMRALPTFQILSPSDHATAGAMFDTCYSNMGLKYLRFDAQVLPQLYDSDSIDTKDGFFVHGNGKDIAMVATGYMVHTALAAADKMKTDGIDVTVIDLFDLSRFSASALKDVLAEFSAMMSLEEGFVGCGGMDAMLRNLLAQSGLNIAYEAIGIRPGYSFELGNRTELHADLGMDVDSVVQRAMSLHAGAAG